ncbi:hypothetical protein SESBI_49659 [Sesbania bispinosa]|nr:hypothetical protein SESBI_49659 [Sesbania bispinosa]
MDLITLILHHGGKLLRNEQRVLEYVGGEVDVWEDLECDILNRFVIIDLCKLHKYHDIQHFYWLYPERDLDLGLREIRKDHDSDIVDMCLASKHNNGEIEIFFEHPVIPDECVVFSKVVVGENTGEMAAEMEDVSHVEDSPDDVVVEEGVEEGVRRKMMLLEETMIKGFRVVAESSKKKGKNVVAESSNKKGKNVVTESSKKKGKNVVAESSKKKGKNVVAESSGRKGKKKVVDSSKKRRVVTNEESSEDDGEGNPPPSVGVGHKQSYAPNLNDGVVGVGEGLPPTPNQRLVFAQPTQTPRVAPMSQVRPNTPFRQPGLIHTTATRPTYTGSTRRKLPTRGGGLSIRPHAEGPRQNAPSITTTVANQTSAAGPFVGGNPSTRPTTISPSVVAGPFQGATASGPSSAAGPFQGASASTCNRFMQFMPTPGFRPPPPKKP